MVAVRARRGAPEETAADTRVVALFEGESLDDERLQRLVELGEAKPGLKKVAVAHEDAPGGGQRRVLIAGLGKRDELDPERARVAAAAAAGRAKELGAVSLSWAAPAGDGIAGAVVEGTLLKLYRFDRFKSSEDDDGDGGLELLDREAIVTRGMGAFASVAQGTYAEPRLIVLRYRPANASGPHLGYVGKAVTFDTGGISIKPSAKMQEMKYDMSGGAAVIEGTGAIARLGLPV